jgi:hypothetical protein
MQPDMQGSWNTYGADGWAEYGERLNKDALSTRPQTLRNHLLSGGEKKLSGHA